MKMPSFKTCHGCSVAKKTCARFSEISDAIAKTGITSVEFKCESKVDIFRPGQRVNAKIWFFYEFGGEGGADYEMRPATVMMQRWPKVIVKVDDPSRMNSETGYAKLGKSKVVHIDEPYRVICQDCQSPGTEFSQCLFSQTSHDDRSSYGVECLKFKTKTTGE
jgi:hypothetical protein